MTQRGIPYQFVPGEKMNRIVKGAHQGVVAYLAQIDYVSFEEMVEGALSRKANPIFLLLDGISDVRNLGAIARSAECAGIDGIVVPERGSAAINADAVKTSAGALLRIPTARVPNLRTALYYFRDSDFQIVAASEKAEDAMYDVNFRKGIPAAPEAVAENIALSDIVRASSDDIEALYGTSDGEAVYREYIAPLCPNFILTRGAKDAEVFSPGVRALFPVAPVREVVTTIGAGDNFNAGTLYSLVRDGFKRDRLAALSEEDWRRIIPTAMRFSAEVCGSLFNYVSPEFVRGLQQA